MATLKIKKGDTVKVIAGKDKDKEGKVLSVDPKKNKVYGVIGFAQIIRVYIYHIVVLINGTRAEYQPDRAPFDEDFINIVPYALCRRNDYLALDVLYLGVLFGLNELDRCS